MKRYREGDVVLIAFPFSGGGSKRRPALSRFCASEEYREMCAEEIVILIWD